MLHLNKKKMLAFPNAKINLGLRVTEKRTDGYHNIETIFVPIPLCDILEVRPTSTSSKLTITGIKLEGELKDNLCMKALGVFQTEVGCPNVAMHLHKQIPSGAGLGGGSSDAAMTLRLLATLFSPKLSQKKLLSMASELGSDCSFFVENVASLAKGRGELLQPIDLDLSSLFLVLVSPPIHVSTAEAYSGIVPQMPEHGLAELIKQPIEKWQGTILNDFEENVFKTHPTLRIIKENLIAMGASYAAMTGSGSTIFGLFRQKPSNLSSTFPGSITDYYKL